MTRIPRAVERRSGGGGGRRRRWLAGLLAATILLVAGVVVLASPAAAPSRPVSARASSLTLGSQTLARCAPSPAAYCGRLSVPLDYGAPSGPRISIAFRWYPASSAGPASAASAAAHAPGRGGARALGGTVVPVEGGPGYPSIESVSYRSGAADAGYAAMYGPLLAHSNMLVLDNRGTGESTPIRCPALQGFAGPTGTSAFQQAASECADALNHRWRYADGRWVHASDLFSSAPAAKDMAAVIEALGIAKVDLYGDSYGSFFAQAFASRFPRLVRSLTLDSTYQTSGLDPWYRGTAQSMPGDFDAACSRWSACAQLAPGSSWARIGALAGRLREHAISGRVPGPSGAVKDVHMDIVGLVDLLSDAAEDTRIYGAIDAAARALLVASDPAPLLRLYAQREHEDEGYFDSPVSEYSVGLYVADACIDYPQLFDTQASRATRAAQLIAGESALPRGTFGPFSPAEWISQNENTEAFSVCIGWPSPSVAQPPTGGAVPLLPSSLPVLVLGGELDSWTPPLDAPKVLAQLGGHSRFVELANSTHVVGEGNTECGSALIQAFVRSPRAVDSLDASCAPAVAPIHTVGVYPATLSERPPLQPSPGSGASTAELRLAAGAVQTAGDAITRWRAIEAKLDHGLRGGTVTAAREGGLLKLRRDQLIAGVAVSGTVALSPSPIAGSGETALAKLTVKAAGAPALSLMASWTTAGAGAQARVTGTSGGHSLAGTMPAP